MQCEWNKITSYFSKARYATIIINTILYLVYSSDKLVFEMKPLHLKNNQLVEKYDFIKGYR